MAEQENVRVDLEGNALEALQRLSNEMEELKGSAKKLEGGIDKSAVGLITGMNQAREAIGAFAQPLREGRDEVFAFDHSLRELSGITGVVDEGLELIGDSAIASAKKFGGDAAKNLEMYQVLLSKLNPEIANKPAALASMGDSVQTLAMTMKGDVNGAVRTLNSSMNQFGVDLKDPEAAAERMSVMMNMIAAGAQKGSAEVPEVGRALEEAGAVAHKAGVGFAETNAAIQVLDKFGKEGGEGGIALRNVLSIMGKEEFLPRKVKAQLVEAGVDLNVLSDRSLTFGQRLAELDKIKDNQSLLGGMFGMENSVAITGLLESQPLLAEYTRAIEENKTAGADMADVIGESYLTASNRIKAQIASVRLSVFSLTGDALPWLDAIGGGFMGIVEMAPGVMAISEGMTALRESTRLATFATWLQSKAQTALNFAMNMNPVAKAIAAIALLSAGAVYAWNNFEGFRSTVTGLWESFKTVFTNIGDFFFKTFSPIFSAIDNFKKGDYAAAALDIGKVALNVATLPIRFGKAVLDGDITKGVGDAYADGKKAGSASFIADNAKEETSTTAASFIPSGNEVATTNQTAATRSGGGQSVTGSVKGAKMITVNIQQLVGKIENHFSDSRETAEAIREKVSAALIGAVRDFELQQ